MTLDNGMYGEKAVTVYTIGMSVRNYSDTELYRNIVMAIIPCLLQWYWQFQFALLYDVSEH